MATDIRMPHLGMIMTEGTLAKWYKSAGETVAQGEPLAEIATEKITYELEAPATGVFHPVVTEGDVVPVEGLIAHLLAEGESLPKPQKVEAATPQSSSASVQQRATIAPPPEGIRAAPAARRLASELGIDISQVPPSRPGGRIVEADVRAYVETSKSSTPAPGIPTASRVEPMKGIRRTIANNMRRSLADSAQLSFHLDIDMTEAMALRRQHSQRVDVSISTVDIFIKACAEALVKHPQLNTVLQDGQIHYFDEVNMGVAVALDEGLMVPVVHRVHDMNISAIAKERASIVAKTREGKLHPDDVGGGTFTLTVLGTVDGFTPILNPGQSAILGVGRVDKRPVVSGDEIVIREMATLSLTVDHQVVDGAQSASFLRRLKQILEHPEPLFKT